MIPRKIPREIPRYILLEVGVGGREIPRDDIQEDTQGDGQG